MPKQITKKKQIEQAQKEALSEAAKLVLARRDLAIFAQEVLRDPEGNKIEIAPIHDSWVKHLNYCWRIDKGSVILSPYQHGKCPTGNTYIYLANGKRQLVENLVGKNFDILSWDEITQEYKIAKAHCTINGYKEVITFTFQNGASLSVTEEHPIWTPAGWVLAKNLKDNDFVASARYIPELGTKALLDGEAALLGYFVGDGCCTGVGINIHADITNADAAVLNNIKVSCDKLDFDCNIIPTKSLASRAAISDGVRPWLREHDLAYHSSHTKRVPDAIFTAPNYQIAEFIAAYFECDGTVNPLRSGSLEFYSVNKELLEDVQSLLLRFGIVSILKSKKGKYKDDVHWSFRLIITGKEMILKFRNHINLVGDKKVALDNFNLESKTNKLKNGKKAHRGSTNIDIIPKYYRSILLKSSRWHRNHTGINLDQRCKFGTSREIVKLACEAENNHLLAKLIDPKIFWNKIIKVEKSEIAQQTYAIEVDDYHTFLANDIITHNTAWMALALPLWMLGQNPNFRITIVSSAEKIAAKRLQEITNYIESSEDYHRIFPWVKLDPNRPNTDYVVNVTRDARFGAIDYSIEAYGYTSSEGQGSRTDLLIFDDVADEKNSCISPKNRQNLEHLVTSQWLSRRNRSKIKDRAGKVISNKGLLVAIGTRFHEEDIYNYFLESPQGFCTLEQKYQILDTQSKLYEFRHLQTRVVGSLDYPKHPVIQEYKNWEPPE